MQTNTTEIKLQFLTRNTMAQWCPFAMTEDDRIEAGYGRRLLALSEVAEVIRKWRTVNPS